MEVKIKWWRQSSRCRERVVTRWPIVKGDWNGEGVKNWNQGLADITCKQTCLMLLLNSKGLSVVVRGYFCKRFHLLHKES